MGVCAEMKTQVSSVNARVKRDSANISITAQITNLDHLHTLLRKLSNVKDVRAVFRVTKREARVSG
jgi:(p)ppGpp synthase/HD superfamily hydrolase